jgi:hypothetical protein
VVSNSTGLYRHLNYLIDFIEDETYTCWSHRATTTASPIRKWNFIPVWTIFIENFNGSTGGFTWSSTSHICPTFFVLYGDLFSNTVCIGLFSTLGQGFGCGYMHDSVIAISPSEIDIEIKRTFSIGHLHHLFMDDLTAGLKLPRTIFIAHSISYCG